MKFWVDEFKRGHTSLSNNERSGRPKIAIGAILNKQVHQIVINNRRIMVKEIAKIVGISKERVFSFTCLPE